MRPSRLLSLVFGGGPMAAATCVGILAGMGVAQAQGKLDARYTVTLAGLPIGRGAWAVTVGEENFTAAASGETAGLMRVFSSGHGTTASRGLIANGTFLPAAYASTVSAGQRTDEIRIALGGGTVQDYSVVPPSRPDPARIPLTEAHMRALDPMTASLARVSGTADPVNPQACNRGPVAVFDGRLRYDLVPSFKRMERVKADKGYQGPVVVCAMNFIPIAGHDPERTAIKYLAEQRDMEVWLAPIAGTRVLAPFKVIIPTPIGLGVLEATQFVTTRASATAKTQ